MKKRWQYFKLMCQEITSFSWKLWIWMLVKIVVEIGLPFAQLLLSAQVIRWLMTGMEINQYLIKLGIWMLGIALLSGMQFRLMLLFEKEEQFFRIEIMDKLIEKYVNSDYPLILSEAGQEKYSKAMNLISNNLSLFNHFMTDLISLMSAFLSVVVYLSLMFQLESLFLVLLFVLMVGLVVFKAYQNKMMTQLNKEISTNEKRVSYLSRLYSDTRVAKDIRLYQMVEWFEDIMKKLAQDHRNIHKPKVKLTLFENVFLSINMIVLTGLAYLRSTQLIIDGQLEASEFVVYVGAVTLLAGTATQLVNQLAIMNQNLVEAGYYHDFMNQAPVFNHREGKKLPEKDLEIELRNVTYTYSGNETPTLKNVSMHFKPSEKIAIVGENGAGKTTLIKLICGLILPDEGEILINGIPQTEFNIHEYYRLFSTVFQDINLLTYTIKETIVQGLSFDEKRYQKVLVQSGVDKIVASLPNGDETKIVRKVYKESVQLSGGQLQKLKLAQALYKDGSVIILDEPTAALDPIAEHEVYQDYLQFSKEKLSFFISHRLSSTRFCDRIIYMKQGEITEVGTHEKLLADKKDYHRLYEAQAYYYRKDIVEESIEEPEVGGVI